MIELHITAIHPAVLACHIGVDTYVLVPCDALVLTAEWSATTTRTQLIGVVGTTYDGRLTLARQHIEKERSVVAEIFGEELRSIAKPLAVVGYHVGTQASSEIAEQTLLLALFESEIDDSLCIIVFKTGELGHIRFLVDNLYLINHLCRYVLGSSLHIVSKELLPVNTDAFDSLSVDRHITFFVNLYSVHSLEQFFHRSILAYLISCRVILQSITFDSHLCSLTRHLNLAQRLNIFLQTNSLERQVLTSHCNRLSVLTITYTRDDQMISTLLNVVKREVTV